ncbi:hypothetical protein B9Z19DRAFT_1197697 [Tuber borchii]|uniref:Uncharacterized protein n=1 Tax=Tuber borchii TaxID=42251 RepID=A0A2T6Z9V0_TUBBO|nr:hypothetical protein B9Z19DRAFT_1197697 [Tuber borchii]
MSRKLQANSRSQPTPRVGNLSGRRREAVSDGSSHLHHAPPNATGALERPAKHAHRRTIQSTTYADIETEHDAQAPTEYQQKYTMRQPDSRGVRHAIIKPLYDGVLRHPICPPPKGHPHTSIFHGATESSEGGPDSGGVRYAIVEPFYDGVLRHPLCPPPKGHHHTSIFHGATESSEGGIPGALGMRSRSPFTTAFYAIPSVHRQKDVSIRAFSMALQSPLKGIIMPDSKSVKHAITKPFYEGVLRYPVCPPPKGRPHTSISHGATDFSEGGALMPDSGGVRHAIMKPFYEGVLRHPICPPPKGRLHTSISHGATEFSEGGVLMAGSGGVRHAIMKPFYEGVLRHPICPPPKGRLHTSISHGATEFSEGGVLMADSGGVRHAIMKPFYDGVLHHPICRPPEVRPHKSIFHGATESSEGGSLRQVFLVLGVYRALTLKPDSGGVKHAIAKPFYDGVLRHPICPPPKGHPHTSIFHGATESSEGGIPGALGMRSWSPFMTAFYTIQAVHRQKGVSIEGVSIALSP